MKTEHPSFIVGIVGSAGALDAYRALLEALPANMGMAYVIISHMSTTAHSQLATILSRHTKMPTMVASPAMPIRRDHVYVIPADADLTVEGHAFSVVSPRVSRSNQGDLFLSSLAEMLGAHAIGIIFSGYGGDGTQGCRHIKAKGGTTFAQDSSAEIDFMPLSARASGAVDFVLPPGQMPVALKRLVKGATRKKGS